MRQEEQLVVEHGLVPGARLRLQGLADASHQVDGPPVRAHVEQARVYVQVLCALQASGWTCQAAGASLVGFSMTRHTLVSASAPRLCSKMGCEAAQQCIAGTWMRTCA